MSENTPNSPDEIEEYSVKVDLEALKFIYISCVQTIADMDFEHFNDRKSLVHLKTCIQLSEQLEQIDPDWLSQNGFSFKKGFHISWIHWIKSLNH